MFDIDMNDNASDFLHRKQFDFALDLLFFLFSEEDIDIQGWYGACYV